MEALTKQTKEHNEKQDDVSGEGYENVELENMQVEHHTMKPGYLHNVGLIRDGSQKVQLRLRLIIYPHNGWKNGTFISMGVSELRKRKELTLNLEYNVNYPSANCDCYDNLLLVPNGETDSTRASERRIRGRIIESRKQDVHAEHDQKRSGGSG